MRTAPQQAEMACGGAPGNEVSTNTKLADVLAWQSSGGRFPTPAVDPPPNPTADLLEAALDYAERGWQVIPLHNPEGAGCSCGHPDCESRGKHPRTKNGLKDATSKPETIRGWWKRWPQANIGLATGPLSGFFVLDCDGKQRAKHR